MDKLNMYITFIIFIKVCFVILAISHLYLKLKHKDGSKTDKTIVFWKERLEFIFVILMAALLIYLFKPDSNRDILITHETKILLYLFGFILLITANWEDFIHESPFYKMLQKIV
jgi:L-asparagine transporter-like permease